MPRLYVLFDTNLYRTLSGDDFAQLLQLERNQSVIAYGSYLAGIELLSHLASDSDPAFRASWSALRRLARHCTQYDGQRSLVRWIADHEDQSCKALFGRGLPHHRQRADSYGKLVGEIAQLTSTEELAIFRQDLIAVAEYVRRSEQAFADEIWTNVVLRFAPDASNWQALHRDASLRRRAIESLKRPQALRLAAGLVVDLSAAALGIELTDSQRLDRIDRAVELFGAPLHFFISILRSVIVDGYDLSKPGNVNSLWDYQVLFSTSPTARLEGMPFWLVTNDSKMLSAARTAGTEHVMKSLSDYRAHLESSSW